MGERRSIEPKILKGFRDALPPVAEIREALIAEISDSYRAFGYRPIDTPALEYLDILRAKGGSESDKQMYSFTDSGGREVAMRFDLTVPLARYVARYENELRMPARLYHIGKVWRGERPQLGRYREFTQCDADIIGATSALADAEIIGMLATTLDRLGLDNYILRMNDRRIFTGLLAGLDLGDRSEVALRALDKIEKVGEDGVREELAANGIAGTAADEILGFAAARGDSDKATLDALEPLMSRSDEAAAGLDSLRTVRALIKEIGVNDDRVVIDPSIVRGLDYYTGTVFETVYLPVPQVGSITSGGRYDDLTQAFSEHPLPGVGGSIGLDRILAAVLEVEAREVGRQRNLVVIAYPQDNPAWTVSIAGALRAGGIQVEIYPEPQSHKAQMRLANARNANAFVTVDPDGSVHVVDLRSGDRVKLGAEDCVPALLERFAAPSDLRPMLE